MYAICNCRLATTDQLGGSERDGEGGSVEGDVGDGRRRVGGLGGGRARLLEGAGDENFTSHQRLLLACDEHRSSRFTSSF